MSNPSQPISDVIDRKTTVLTDEQLISRLRKALARDGDFPASAKIVSELRQLTNDPDATAQQITEVILREPSLGTRVLGLVNSSFYQRAKPIMTVSQAVVQIGMKPLAEMCAGLVLLQRFIPVARRDSVFATCLKRLLVTSLLASSIANELSRAETGKGSEAGYLTGTLSEMGTLLLAYYFPRIYEAAVKRAEVKQLEISQSIREITGLTPLRLSVEVIDALGLPEVYHEILMLADGAPDKKAAKPGPANTQMLSQALKVAQSISSVIVAGKNKTALEQAVAKGLGTISLKEKELLAVIAGIPSAFTEHAESLELGFAPLPDYISSLGEAPAPVLSAAEEKAQEKENATKSKDQYSSFVDEIRQAVNAGDPTSSIITSCMETLAWGLKFQRVLLLLMNGGKTTLGGRMFLGEGAQMDPKKINRPLPPAAPASACDATAVRDGRAIFAGDPVLPGGWPLVAIPIGFGARCVGVIYADRVNSGKREELSSREQAALGVLAELLNQSLMRGG
jgi:hypothetical protein